MDITINTDVLFTLVGSALAIGVLIGCAIGNHAAHTDKERGRHEPR